MQWAITEVDDVAVMQMLSNKVNKQNDEFFSDLQAAFDRVEAELPGRPVVLHGQGTVFSAGLDFEYTFPIFARQDEAEISAWFQRFSAAILRVFTYPYPTVAAVNGHAMAGGLILAMACDHRVAAAGPGRCGLNEVPVGIPMPSLYTELVRARVGSAVTSEAILTGKLYSCEEAHRAGFYQEVVSAEELLDRACAHARLIPAACRAAYVHSKKMVLRPTMDWIEQRSRELDRVTVKEISSPAAQAAQAQALARLKAR
ncbi:MAG: enoyl-CoA hydratase/isomerase family protein [Kofleriaceae bacterium]